MRGLQRYELDERIGTGGLAEVFRGTGIARDGARELVVVKRLLEPFSHDPLYEERFWAEARTASVLRHPNVVELLDAGRVDGRLFLAYEYVDGADLQRILSRVRETRRRLTLGASLHIVYEILKGLHYVHLRTDDEGLPLRIVHRELSPENVLISRAGEVKLADVGLAKATIRAGRVVSGAIQGDPHYMAPEQLAGTRVDARTDVYAAGMILFTLLAGQHPLYDVPLGKLLPLILAGATPEISRLRPDLPAELANAVMRAIRPNPSERFPTAQELQLTLIEYANDKKIRLEGKKLADFLAVNFADEDLAPGPLASQAPFEPIVMEATGSVDAPVPEESKVRTPMKSAIFATAAPVETENVRKSARPTVIRGGEPAAKASRKRKTVIRSREQIKSPKWTAPAAPEHEEDPEPTRHSPRTVSPSTIAKAIPPKSASGQDAGKAVWLEGHTHGVAAVAFLPDGKHALTAGSNLAIAQWDLGRRRQERLLEGHRGAVTAIAISRDGLVAVSGGRDKIVAAWDLATGELSAKLEGHRGWVFSVDVSPDGTRAVSGGIDGAVRVWDLSAARSIATLKGHEDSVSQVVLFAEGRRALSGSRDGTLRLWDLRAKEEERAFAAGVDSVRAVAVTQDGKLALSAGSDPVLRMWDLERGSEVHQFEGHREPIAAVAFSPDARRVISGGYDGTLRLWDVRTGTALEVFEGHTEPVLSVAFSSDGTRAMTGGADHRAAIWPLSKK